MDSGKLAKVRNAMETYLKNQVVTVNGNLLRLDFGQGETISKESFLSIISVTSVEDRSVTCVNPTRRDLENLVDLISDHRDKNYPD